MDDNLRWIHQSLEAQGRKLEEVDRTMTNLTERLLTEISTRDVKIVELQAQLVALQNLFNMLQSGIQESKGTTRDWLRELFLATFGAILAVIVAHYTQKP